MAGGALLLLLSAPSTTFAGSATWSPAPGSGDWNTAGNWVAGGPPNGPADTATFATSTQTAVSISANTEVNGIVFNAAASAFTITASPTFTLTISGTGITNNSGVTQNFVTAVQGTGNRGVIAFTNSATAGSLTAFSNNGGGASGAPGGATQFFNTATAASGTFTNNGGLVSGASGGSTDFVDSSTAANGTFTNNGGLASGINGGFVNFLNSSTAGSGTFTNNGGTVNGAFGGFTALFDTSTASNGIFTNNGGAVSGASGGVTQFFGTSTAGSGTFITNGGAVSGAGAGVMQFFNTSTAGNGTFTNNGVVSGAGGSITQFRDTSTAANGIFTNNGGPVSGAAGGLTDFVGSSTAGNGTFTNNGGVSGADIGATEFQNTSTAGAATLIANGGTGGGGGGVILFANNSTGGTARVEVFGNGNLDISFHLTPGMTIGSIEGSGNVFLGANNLTVGSNNLSPTFSGVIQNGGLNGGTGGSLTKIGTGTLSLTNSNTYTGGTLINAGTLIGGHDGALGAGNVSLTASGVTLTLQNGATNNYISDNSKISIVTGATANLNFTGTSDIVGSIAFDGMIQTGPGTYGSASSGATFQSAFFSGTGTLLLIPEPSTWTMMGLGAAMLLAVMRFRRRRS